MLNLNEFLIFRSLQPVLVLKRLTAATIRKWTKHSNSKAQTKHKSLKARASGQRKSNFNCDVCGKSVVTRAAVEEHLNLHFKCPHLFCDLCPKSFRDKKGIQIHLTSHLPEKPFTCKKCGFGTIYKHSLFLHRALHREERTECPLCHKMVTVLKTHMKRTHTRNDKQVQCELCGKTMVVHKLARHTNMVHAENRECLKCKEKFNTRGLKMWVRVDVLIFIIK